jgi:hypothetical protein
MQTVIRDFAFGSILVDVYDDNLGRQSADQKGIGERSSDEASAHDNDFWTTNVLSGQIPHQLVFGHH